MNRRKARGSALKFLTGKTFAWAALALGASAIAAAGYLAKEPAQAAPSAAPLTAVAITQCNQLVAVYVTMPDGKLVRFDKASSVPSDKALEIAQSAQHSERIEVNCDKVSS